MFRMVMGLVTVPLCYDGPMESPFVGSISVWGCQNVEPSLYDSQKVSYITPWSFCSRSCGRQGLVFRASYAAWQVALTYRPLVSVLVVYPFRFFHVLDPSIA